METSARTDGGSGGIGVLEGKTTAEMKQQDTYVGWDFLSIWVIDEDTTYPSLKEMKEKVVT